MENQTNPSDHDHDHSTSNKSLLISASIFLVGLVFQYFVKPNFFIQFDWFRAVWYGISYLFVGLPVLNNAVHLAKEKDFFNEFSLMTIATLGAFLIKEYPEGVAVMLFYAVGEKFQEAAVDKAKDNIKALLDVRPNTATRINNGKPEVIDPKEIKIDDEIEVKVGEKLPIDGSLINEKASVNTAALTGESKPQSIKQGETILAGSINLDEVIRVKTTKQFNDTSLAKILQLVQEATAKKAKTELLIRKFARVYTPIVFGLAILVLIVPFFFVSNYVFQDWLYRALVFLVVSCPCALVISIPLGYFGGIGAASKNGILFKGSTYLDTMANVSIVVVDKTRTITEGIFKVRNIETSIPQNEFLDYTAALESKSTHPIAKAIIAYHPNFPEAESVKEISGMGLQGIVNNKKVLVGNLKLLKYFNIKYPDNLQEIVETIVVVAVNQSYVGHIIIADQIKEDAYFAIAELKKVGVRKVIMLSGDADAITQKVAKRVNIDEAFGNLMPEGKVEKVTLLKENPENCIAFVGDGINDAPVLALSDVGIAMGGLGSDAAIETADVIIQTDQPSKIATAIKIGRKTKQIVIQNIALAFIVKAIVLVLGAGGLATMWEAVFADVGVSFLAILNAIRLQKIKF